MKFTRQKRKTNCIGPLSCLCSTPAPALNQHLETLFAFLRIDVIGLQDGFVVGCGWDLEVCFAFQLVVHRQPFAISPDEPKLLKTGRVRALLSSSSRVNS